MGTLEIKPIQESSHRGEKLLYEYETDTFYDVATKFEKHTWQIRLELKSLPEKITKKFESQLFEPYVEHPLAFACWLGEQHAGYMQLGFDSWNKRLRIWELLVAAESRSLGYGSQLLAVAKEEGVKLGARMIVLETQSCNTPAIRFYLKQGFQLIGFDLAAYSNEDLQKREIRLEFGLAL